MDWNRAFANSWYLRLPINVSRNHCASLEKRQLCKLRATSGEADPARGPGERASSGYPASKMLAHRLGVLVNDTRHERPKCPDPWDGDSPRAGAVHANGVDKGGAGT